MTLSDKVEQMRKGFAVVASGRELSDLIAEGYELRTAHNAERVGVHDGWVCWMSGYQSTHPPNIQIDTDHRAHATAGRCHFARDGAPVPDDFRVMVGHSE